MSDLVEPKKYTTKQMSDACEMIVAAELTLAGVPALKVPDLWPGYDVIAQPVGKGTQRVSVKSRTFKTGSAYVGYNIHDVFDWLAIVLLGCSGDKPRRVFVVPRAVANRKARRDRSPNTAHLRYWRVDEVAKKLGHYEDNFTLAG
jgi:hypothetical protein